MRPIPLGMDSLRVSHAQPWLDHWLETCRDLAALTRSAPDDGRGHRRDRRPHDPRRRTVAGRLRLLQLPRLRPRPEIIDAIPAYLDAWGTHPSWSRLLGSPVLYEQIEEQLTELLGCEDSLVLPDDHAHPHVGDPGARRPRARSSSTRARTRRSTTAARSRAATARRCSGSASKTPTHLDAAAARRARPHCALVVHGRREQHDRQRARPGARSPRSLARTARCCTSTTRTASA